MEFQTPEWVCTIMAKMISELIIFPETILEPTPGAGNLVKAIDRRYPSSIIYTPVDFFQFYKKVDCIVGNPPFTPMKVGYDILSRCFELSDNIIFLMPWLALINSEQRTQLYMDRGLKKVVHLPRKAFPGSRVQTCIMQLQEGYHDSITFTDAQDSRRVDDKSTVLLRSRPNVPHECGSMTKTMHKKDVISDERIIY